MKETVFHKYRLRGWQMKKQVLQAEQGEQEQVRRTRYRDNIIVEECFYLG